MMISINNMVSSNVVRQILGKTTSDLGQNLQRLSSGLRVNSAKDGGGALSVAMHMTSKIGGLSVAKQNANDGLSLVQVADAALEETVGALQNIRDLALDAGTATKSAGDRTALSSEINTLISEISRIATMTTLFNQNLLTGSFSTVIQVGADPGQTVALTIAGASLLDLELGEDGSKLDVDIAGAESAAAAAEEAVDAVDVAMDSVAVIRATLGGAQSRFESIINIIDSSSLAYTSARSNVLDVDVAEESADMARNSILQQAGIAVMAQANLQPQALLKLLSNVGK